MEIGGTYSKIEGPNAAQSDNQREGRDQGDNRAEDDKTTKQGRRESPGTGKQQIKDNGRH